MKDKASVKDILEMLAMRNFNKIMSREVFRYWQTQPLKKKNSSKEN